MWALFRHKQIQSYSCCLKLLRSSNFLTVTSTYRCLYSTPALTLPLQKRVRLRNGLNQEYLSGSPFLHRQSVMNFQMRHFWGLEVAFNKVDEERVKFAGPDRAAAEWILRNEGSLKWTQSDKYLKNYNFLPSTDFESYKIEVIDLTATNVIGLGFEHLENLKHVKSIKLHGCRTIRDDALGHLHFVQDTLEFLDISRCPMITEKGLDSLHCLKNLKTLIIYDLIEIKSLDGAVSRLSKAMPWCQMMTSDPLVENGQQG